jgi:hypothetical protein
MTPWSGVCPTWAHIFANERAEVEPFQVLARHGERRHRLFVDEEDLGRLGGDDGVLIGQLHGGGR